LKLDEAILPGTAPLNVGRLGPDGSDPVLHGLGEEFRSVVGSDVFGHTTQNELIGQYVDHVGGLELPVDPDGQTFVGELVDEIEHPILPPFVRAILDEVIGPDMVRPLGAQTDSNRGFFSRLLRRLIEALSSPAAPTMMYGTLVETREPEGKIVRKKPSRGGIWRCQKASLAVACTDYHPGRLPGSNLTLKDTGFAEKGDGSWFLVKG
jgi:hypothetical protein